MRLKYLGFILVIGILVSSCKKNEAVGLFTSADLNNLTVDYIDTFTINTSTVKMDSLPTFGSLNNNIVLVGNYKDPVMGTISAQPYFQVGLPGNAAFDLSKYKFLGIKLDSMRFVMYYNSAPIEAPAKGNTTPVYTGTYYPFIGDTLQPQTYTLYRMTDDFTLYKLLNTNTPGTPISYFYNSQTNSAAVAGQYTNNSGTQTGYLFNTSKFNYDVANPLGTTTFIPRPRSKTFRTASGTGTSSSPAVSLNDSIVFKMPDSLGNTFLNMAINSAFAFQVGGTNVPNGNFVQFFKGLTVVSNTTGNILSFNPSQSHMRLYFQESINGILSPTYVDFGIATPTTASPTLFNHIQADYTGTPLQGVKPFVKIPSSQTGHQTFVQAGTGLMTRVEIPYLHNFLTTHPTISINRAELIIQTGATSATSIYPTIPYLWLYTTDITNIPQGVLGQDFNAGTPQASLFNINYSGTQVGFYKYFVVQYTGALLNTSAYNGAALLLGPSGFAMDNSVERVIIGDQTNQASKPILRIYYSKLGNN